MTQNAMPHGDIGKYLSVFISCANENLKEAQTYRDDLEERGFTVKLYDENPYGEKIDETVKADIVNCHFFLLLVSEYSAAENRPWVSREFGLALETRDKNGGYRPIIIPVYCKDPSGNGTGARIVKFPVRSFDNFESLKCDTYFDLSSIRAHDPHRNPVSDTFDQLVRSMQIEIRLVRKDISSADDLENTGAIELYHEMFAEDQRAPLEDDLHWIFKTDTDEPFPLSIPTSKRIPVSLLKRMGVRGEFRLKSFFFVLLRRERAIGFAWVTYHRGAQLLYGNYIGVQEQWRRGSLSVPLIQRIYDTVLDEFPKCRGLVLEVEPFSLQEVEQAVEILEGGAKAGEEERAKAIQFVRNFKRVWWYETSPQLLAKCVRDVRTRQPLVHMYPCMETDARPEDWHEYERPYWLLIAHLRDASSEHAWSLWKRAMEFSILENMAKRTVMDRPEIAETYWNYALGVYYKNIREAERLTGRKVEFAPVFGLERAKDGKARQLYLRIKQLPFEINM